MCIRDRRRPKKWTFWPWFPIHSFRQFLASLGRTVSPQYKTLQTDRQQTDRRHSVPKAQPIVRSANKPPLDGSGTSHLLSLRSTFFGSAINLHERKGELGGRHQLGISYVFSTCLSLSDLDHDTSLETELLWVLSAISIFCLLERHARPWTEMTNKRPPKYSQNQSRSWLKKIWSRYIKIPLGQTETALLSIWTKVDQSGSQSRLFVGTSAPTSNQNQETLSYSLDPSESGDAVFRHRSLRRYRLPRYFHGPWAWQKIFDTTNTTVFELAWQ